MDQLPHNIFGGRLYAPGLDGVGVPATGQWRKGRLVVWVPDGGADHAWQSPEHPTLSAGGFNGAQLSVAWPADGGQVQFFVDTGSAHTVFAQGLPASLSQPHGAAQRSARGVERRFKLWWAALATVALLPVLALTLLVLRGGDVVDWAVQQIPHAQEAKLGDLVLAQTRAQMRVIDSGPAVDAVKHIGERLTPGTLHRYRWLVVDKNEMNAFAAPGGVVVVYSGLLKGTDSPEQAAGVIAHEVAHAELRHGLQGMVKSLGLQAAAAVLLGDWSGALLSEITTSLLEMKFSREAETQADAEGLRRLVAAKINPEGMARFMHKLATQSQGGTPPALLSTHPASQDRADQLRALAAQHRGPWEPLALDWGMVKASLP
nr:M48 family metallopeptidase [uncultured Rhodoferax sp.]